MNRRDFLKTTGAAGAATFLSRPLSARDKPHPRAKNEYHVFSKMFQPSVCDGYDAVAELMARAGFDGIEWTVRPGGHVLPERAGTDLPKAVSAARKQGLKSTLMVVGFTDGDAPASETLLRIAADQGFRMFRPGYFHYGKGETFRQSLDRIRRGFASLARLAERTGLKCVYQNHSSWGPSLFGGLVWDIHEMIRDLDPRWIGLEYDPMHAYFETSLSWVHGFDLVADRIGAVCLKDFHYRLSPKNPKNHEKSMCPAGAGIVPWQEVNSRLKAAQAHVPFTVHFEYDFDKADLLKSVKTELDAFRRIFDS